MNRWNSFFSHSQRNMLTYYIINQIFHCNVIPSLNSEIFPWIHQFSKFSVHYNLEVEKHAKEWHLFPFSQIAFQVATIYLNVTAASLRQTSQTKI